MDAGALALERAPAGIVFVGIVAEQGEVGGIGTRADTGSDGIHDPAAPLRSELVENGFLCSGERGESIKFGAGTVGNAVKDNKKDFIRGHSYGMVGRAD